LLTTPLSSPVSQEQADRFLAVAALDLWASSQIIELMLDLEINDIQMQYATEVAPQAFGVLSTAQRRAAQIGADYVDDLGLAQDIPVGPRLAPTALAGVASDGRALETLLFQPLIKMLLEDASGVAFPDALRVGRNSMTEIISTQVHDAARVAEGTKIAANKRWKGYVRMVEPSACSRCIILAGRTYAWNTGFQRHPRCRCTHIPTSIASPDIADPKELFDQMSRKEQDRAFTRDGAEAIRLGADPARVVNARAGMNTTQTASGREVKQAIDYRGQKGIYITRAGTGTKRQRGQVRLMPESILRFAAGNRDEAIRLLRVHGYIL
jgi:Asp/Glu/hydantoin racemase